MSSTFTPRAPVAAQLWLCVTTAITLAPHTLQLPTWLTALCVLLLGLNLLRIYVGSSAGQPYVGQPWRGRAVRIVLMLAVFAIAAGVHAQYGYFFGQSPGIALLAALLCLKLIESVTPRDVRAGVLLALFLQLGLFFTDQSPLEAGFVLIGVLCATATLYALESPAAAPFKAFATSARMLLFAAPLMLLLFVLFPRLTPLWALPHDAHSALTGLPDEMSPGSISQLSQSNGIALRAEFEDALPARAQLYWRGPVLSEYDGHTWRSARGTEHATPAYTPSGASIDYTLTVEAHNRRWVLALDFPGARSEHPNLLHSSDFALLNARPLRSRARFALTAWPDTPVGVTESAAVLARARHLPEHANPRTRALMAELVSPGASPEVALERVLTWFADNPPQYTLNPPLMPEHAVDAFLFDARRGFCEHFASAFAVMMRAAGVPARVVTGYQGGTLNPHDGSLVVRHAEAHAWAEVWLEERGWVRVDPTALAAPERVESGLSAALAADDARPFLMRENPAAHMIRALRDRLDALEGAWNRNVAGFDRQRQLDFFAAFDRQKFTGRTAAYLFAVCALGGLAALAWFRMRRRPEDPLDRIWLRFNTLLARQGVTRLPSEGPIAYADRAALALPGLATEIRHIAASYARLRYGPQQADHSLRLRRLAQRIRAFSRRARAPFGSRAARP